ncbi:MAG: hypothetical protein KGI25_09085 [Thaumarchaeota archaeon]|nr:hypothetical protein [Nitrososphaerota archaeon]
MRLFVEFFLIAVLVWAFRTVRAQRIIAEITEASKRRITKKVVSETDIWMKNVSRDTRPTRDRSMEDAPSYTTYTEETGRYRKLS